LRRGGARLECAAPAQGRRARIDAMTASPVPALTCDALVVGAGPSGLLAALSMARAGLDVILAGPPTPTPPGRTVALFEPAKEALRGLGVWDAVEAAGEAAPLRVMRIVDDTDSLFRTPPVDFRASEIGLDAFGDNVTLVALVAQLEAAAAREKGLRQIGEALDDFRFGEDEASARRPDGSRIVARVIVAADGRGSQTRRAAGLTAKSEPTGQIAITCVFRHQAEHDDVSTEFHTRSGPFTLVPMTRGKDGAPRSSLVWLVKPDEADRLMALDDAAFALACEKRAHSHLGKFTLEGGRGRLPMAIVTTPQLVGPRVALMGEAAHVFPPIGAQGLNLGVRDAADLGIALGEAKRKGEDVGGGAALARYASLRKADIATRTAGVDLLNRSLLTDALPMDFLRGAGLTALGSFGPLRRFAMRMGLGPAPGSRLPLPRPPAPRLPRIVGRR
jgi:2-octaprenyl-6-methoxyphenol hydroxylase